jgi:hypothetical protein
MNNRSTHRIARNPFRIRTSEKSPCKSFRMRTSKNIGLKVLQNEHLQKKGGRGVIIVNRASDQDARPERASRVEGSLFVPDQDEPLSSLHFLYLIYLLNFLPVPHSFALFSRNSFVCHSYAKQPGVGGYPLSKSHFLLELSVTSELLTFNFRLSTLVFPVPLRLPCSSLPSLASPPQRLYNDSFTGMHFAIAERLDRPALTCWAALFLESNLKAETE